VNIFLDATREAVRLLLSGDPYVWGILRLSFVVAVLGIILGGALGLPLGIWLGVARFRGRGFLVALVNTGFALPPVVVGLFVYILLSNVGPAGSLQLLFTPAAMVIAQTILAAPYVAGVALAAVQAVPRDVRLQARALGASPARALYMHLREARVGLAAALIAGFGAIFSEVGAVMMVGGNIERETRVLTTAIVLETRRGNYALGMAFGIVLLLIAFAVNAWLTRVQQAQVALVADRPWS
jgi:tungstate transport system permease protein